ncbi:MAG: S8 family serine peptidase [Chlorobi bacterium]|nr:S8 family serine peptidase [Chlorobiota bacterium]
MSVRMFSIGVLKCTVVLVSVLTIDAVSQNTYRVILADKGTSPFLPGSSLYRATEALLTPRALQRRAKVLPPDSLISFRDAPIYEPYVTDIERSGARTLLRLRWRNYLVVECDSTTAALLATKPYVARVEPTSAVLRAQQYRDRIPDYLISEMYRYGASESALRMLGIPALHECGISGLDVLVGVIDTGFRWRSHRAFDGLSVVAERDFIQLDSNTANEEGDHINQDSHGTAVLSVMASWFPDSLVGTTPCASYLLAKTENIWWERRIEEDALGAALEWMEALGVDVVNISLGYSVFDSTESQYPEGALDGKTTIVARAVEDASRRGVVCVVAAGNSGNSPSTISSPGDAPSAITVGAVADTALNIPRFTSRGPTADGRLKPDVAALGVNVRSTSNADPTAFGYASGTSLAAPQITGSIALLLDAYPELRPSEVRMLLTHHASHRDSPNVAIGYGVPNIYEAAVSWDILCSKPIVIPQGDSILVGIVATSTSGITSATLAIELEGTTTYLSLRPSNYSRLWWIRLPRSADTLHCWFGLTDENRYRRYPRAGTFRLPTHDTLLPCRWHTERITLATIESPNTTSGQERWIALPAESAVLPVPILESPAQVHILDMTGRTVTSVTIDPFTRSVTLPRLAAGVYAVFFEALHNTSYQRLPSAGHRISLFILLY